jgi:protein-S-isoprenylcysteine O-methyltransferase Ste14
MTLSCGHTLTIGIIADIVTLIGLIISLWVRTVLGLAIYYGHAIGLVAFTISFIASWLRSRQEEKLLTRRFPKEYPKYKERVKAFIPFVF